MKKELVKELVLEVNEDYGRTTARAVLEDLGYNCVPEYDEEEDRSRWKVYLGDKKYWFKEMDHYNGFVYSITLEEV